MTMELISRAEAIDLGLKRYFTGKPCINGHVAERSVSSSGCMACANERSKAYVRKRYAEDAEFRAKVNKRNSEYAQTEKYKEWNRSRIATDEYRAYRLAYLASPEMREKKRAYDKDRQQTDRYKQGRKERYKSDPSYKVAQVMRSRLVQCARKIKSTEKLSVRDVDLVALMRRIEFNFKPGMSWKNHGEWHIDHIKPIAAFVAQGKSIRLANMLCNLRPEWRVDNMLKSSTFKGVTYRFAKRAEQ